MKVASVDLLPFAIPLRRPLVTARGTIRARAGWIVRFRAEDGTIGLGEAAPHPHDTGRGVEESRAALERACVRWQGADVSQFENAGAFDAATPLWVASAFDTASWDLRARLRDESLASLLGARRGRVPVNALLEADGVEACVREAEDACRRGFTTAKRKVDRGGERTVAEVLALGAAVPQMRLRLDANGVWNEAEAGVACARLARANVEWIEQPLAVGLEAAWPGLRRAAAVPLAADESVRSAADVAALAAAGACDGVVLKLVQVGGLTEALAAARSAASADLPVAVTSGIDTGVGLAAALALAAAVPGRLAPCGLSTAPLLSGDVVRASLLPEPWMTPPAGPGLGVELRDVAASGTFATTC